MLSALILLATAVADPSFLLHAGVTLVTVTGAVFAMRGSISRLNDKQTALADSVEELRKDVRALKEELNQWQREVVRLQERLGLGGRSGPT